MEGAIALDVSSEDSNIATFFQSFDNDGFIINPAKDLSQTFAKIELTIKNPFDFEAQDDLAAKLNRIFNLMVYSIQTTELYPKLEEDFKEYYDKRLNSIFARIFTNELLKILYHLDNDNIDTMWQIHRLVILLYTFVFPELDLRFKIPSETTVVVIKCFQYPLFKYLRTRSDVAMSESMELSTPFAN
ncbi:hypothetical protein PSN45_004099 [Yamadazyma tenuis]|uniref:uncharacterized protein n=1 Tax=Candida tenuis TaxID=2315449 RepID=UPI0027A42C72|nr:hypothetical protein PSN45_004099 [Yamadazyma tenuis]